jgi:hypothetical protein
MRTTLRPSVHALVRTVGHAGLLLSLTAVRGLTQQVNHLVPHVSRVTASPLPFSVGERLEYAAHAGPGLNGTAEMWIEGPEEVRGTSTIVLRFTFAARVGFLKVSDNTTSYLDPIRMASLRFVKEERRLLARHSEDVAIEPLARRFTMSNGQTGTTPSDTHLFAPRRHRNGARPPLRPRSQPDDDQVARPRHGKHARGGVRNA